MVIKSTQSSQYSDNPQIPEAIINIEIKEKGFTSDGQPIKDITCQFKGWVKGK
ncbi:hypothetical protein NIES2100_05200 [Calothrix sp. NIES-2100]|uniref:hypothetical protein n=1 Tax=Calothrix sp. NIES-2100 TaxID=1954172 RepID=UPI000B61E502|nr:hypothetical protein NIES2100_05200 [Calothrix sp. NIES-2100]